MKDPFLIIFCQQLGSASCALLACHFSSWPVLLQSQFSAGMWDFAQPWSPSRQKQHIYNPRQASPCDEKC